MTFGRCCRWCRSRRLIRDGWKRWLCLDCGGASTTRQARDELREARKLTMRDAYRAERLYESKSAEVERLRAALDLKEERES